MKRNLVSLITFLMLLLFMVIFYNIAYIDPLVFLWFICVLYIVAIPRDLFSPKNIIFAYYFLWYALAPAFAHRFKSYTFTSCEEKLAYLMLFFTYGISMVFITFCESYFEKKIGVYSVEKEYYNPRKVKRIIRISITVTLISLALFIYKTGGISRWITDSAMAYISRKGSGGIYLIFLHSLMIFASAYGVLLYKNKGKMSFVKFFLIILVLFPFIGSKGQVILIVFIGMGLFIINRKLISKWTITTVSIVAILFSIGIYQRNYTWMTLPDFVPYSLDYFNTYEMLIILLRDFDPSFLKTVLLPFNKILLIFGQYIYVPFYDMSVWLTSIYYPLDWSVGATQQWPIEADLYMSFYFIFGVPFMMVYLAWISFVFHMAKKRYVSWIVIYIMEFVYIISHYRGGILTYWYIWLIPFYILVILIYGKMRIK